MSSLCTGYDTRQHSRASRRSPSAEAHTLEGMDDRYGSDVLAAGWRERGAKPVPQVPAEVDLVVEVAADGFCGAVTKVQGGTVELEDRLGRRRLFPLGGGFLIDGAPVRLAAPAASAQGPRRTASGSFAVADQRARTALPSRILVEGRHDAELVEKVWGADLRVEGVVVEYLQGVDLLDELLAAEPRVRDGGTESSSTTSCRGRRSPASPRRSPAARTAGTSASWATRSWTSGSASPSGTRHRGMARDPARRRLEDRHLPRVRLAARDPGRHGEGLAAHPVEGHDLPRPRARAPRAGGGVDRLRHRARG